MILLGEREGEIKAEKMVGCLPWKRAKFRGVAFTRVTPKFKRPNHTDPSTAS